MDNPADTPDQTDEDILTHTASDEAVEAAAGIEGGVCHLAFTVVTWCAPTKSMPSGCKRTWPDGSALR
jgi:hypothetical protein